MAMFLGQLEIDCKSQPCTHLPRGVAQGNEQPSVSFNLEPTSQADQRTSLLLINSSTVFELKILTAVVIQKKKIFA